MLRKFRTIILAMSCFLKKKKQLVYIPPTKFCVCPSLGYWELNGKPVSPKEAQCGLAPGAKWMQSEVCRELHLYLGELKWI